MGEGSDSGDRDFKEFTVKQHTVKDFFKMYNTAFYDIPKIGVPIGLKFPVLVTEVDEDGERYLPLLEGPNGENPLDGYYVYDALATPESEKKRKHYISVLNTHKEIVNKSGKKVGDPVGDIEVQIESAQLILDDIRAQIASLPKEHPFFGNGAILEQREEPFTKFFMVDGQTRAIYSGEAYEALLGGMGINLQDTAPQDVTTKVSLEGIEAIGAHPEGPIYSPEDLFAA